MDEGSTKEAPHRSSYPVALQAMLLYSVIHTRPRAHSPVPNQKALGLFSSRSHAQRVVEAARYLPGFQDWPDRFEMQVLPLGVSLVPATKGRIYGASSTPVPAGAELLVLQRRIIHGEDDELWAVLGAFLEESQAEAERALAVEVGVPPADLDVSGMVLDRLEWPSGFVSE